MSMFQNGFAFAWQGLLMMVTCSQHQGPEAVEVMWEGQDPEVHGHS